MQLYVIESSPVRVAQALCDKHVISQVKDVAQLLALAHIRNDELTPPLQFMLPDLRFMNHRCTSWVSQTAGNYQWTQALAEALCLEYDYRYKKKHEIYPDVDRMMYAPFKIMRENKKITPAPAVVPLACLDKSSILKSYRKFYKNQAAKITMNWTRRYPPHWFM